MADERRCPDCGALVSADADWCGQCFASLAEPPPMPGRQPVGTTAASGTAPAGTASETARGVEPAADRPAPTWPCPACGNANAIALESCAVCGTSFAALMRQDERPAPVEPKDAFAWSLVFPGLGHRKVGRPLDGLARGVLFVLLFAMAVLIAMAGISTPLVFGMFALFMGMALLVYLGSAYEAYRMAEGGRAFVSSRHLLWATVVVIMLAVVMLAMSVVTVTRR